MTVMDLRGVDALLFNLLDEPLITVTLTDLTSKKLTLPGVLHSLGENEIESFSNLRPHQKHPWHAFLCQLAAMAITDSDMAIPAADKTTPYSELPGKYSESEWKELLWKLAPSSEPWSLICDDPEKPAFLQPPLPDGIGSLNNLNKTPDELDLIFTSKNFDEKSRKMTSFEPDHWIFSLVSLQGQAPYGGAGNYGGSRQYGGYGTRPGIGIIPTFFWGDQWGRDCRVLIDNLYSGREISWDIEKGHRLLWLTPWDGKNSMSLSSLHPYFLEVCRRVRFARSENGEIIAYSGTSKCGRVEAKDFNGVVDDPWIPIVRSGPNAFNNRPTWENMARILLEPSSYIPSPAQKPYGFDRSPLYVRFSILTRGQGSTDEYHEKIIPIPAEKVKFLIRQDPRAEIILSTMIDLAKNTKIKVLFPAISKLLSGKTELSSENQKSKSHPLVVSCIQILDDSISDRFFDYLWNSLPAGETDQKGNEDLYGAWIDYLRTCSEGIFRDVLRRFTQSDFAGYICAAQAESFFYNSLKKYLPKQEDVKNGG